MGYELKLDSFEGPLELLYQLVKKNKIEISEISLAEITQQYLDYLHQMQEFDLEVGSEFMIIAAELIQIKARTLLPENKEQKNSGEEETDLVQRLQEYHYFKKVSEILDDYQKKGSKFFISPLSYEDIIEEDIELNFDIEIKELINSYKQALKAHKAKKIEDKNDEIVGKLNYDEIKLEDKTEYIIKKLQQVREGLAFEELIEDIENRLEIVVTFLSILELAKAGKINLKKGRMVASIHLI